jgi:hypothetical protein
MNASTFSVPATRLHSTLVASSTARSTVGTTLILIEGMIGSGKTTTARRVGDWLERRGENARVFCECAPEHPIRTEAEDRLPAAAGPQAGPGSAGDARAAGDLDAYAPDQWRRLAERCLRHRQTIILESSYLRGDRARPSQPR